MNGKLKQHPVPLNLLIIYMCAFFMTLYFIFLNTQTEISAFYDTMCNAHTL